MNSQRKRSSWKLLLRRLLALIGVAGAMAAPTSAQAGVEVARQALEGRVLAVRAAIHDVSEADPAAAPNPTLAQWFNWGNWNNWNNWPNWGNWGNWFNR
jgi:hypothetical protein